MMYSARWTLHLEEFLWRPTRDPFLFLRRTRRFNCFPAPEGPDPIPHQLLSPGLYRYVLYLTADKAYSQAYSHPQTLTEKKTWRVFEPVVEKIEHENLHDSTVYSSNCDFVDFKSQNVSGTKLFVYSGLCIMKRKH